MSAEFLNPGENVLIIDDFLATGETLLAMTRMVKQSGAHLIGIGCVIEKCFENGRKVIRESGYADIPIVSIAQILQMDGNKIDIAD